MKIKQKFMAYAMVTTLGLGVLSSGVSFAYDAESDEITGGEMFADAVVVRPLTAAATVVGFAAWVVTLPFTLPSGSTADAGKSWVVDPLGYTFNRPLGDIRDNRD